MARSLLIVWFLMFAFLSSPYVVYGEDGPSKDCEDWVKKNQGKPKNQWQPPVQLCEYTTNNGDVIRGQCIDVRCRGITICPKSTNTCTNLPSQPTQVGGDPSLSDTGDVTGGQPPQNTTDDAPAGVDPGLGWDVPVDPNAPAVGTCDLNCQVQQLADRDYVPDGAGNFYTRDSDIGQRLNWADRTTVTFEPGVGPERDDMSSPYTVPLRNLVPLSTFTSGAAPPPSSSFWDAAPSPQALSFSPQAYADFYRDLYTQEAQRIGAAMPKPEDLNAQIARNIALINAQNAQADLRPGLDDRIWNALSMCPECEPYNRAVQLENEILERQPPSSMTSDYLTALERYLANPNDPDQASILNPITGVLERPPGELQFYGATDNPEGTPFSLTVNPCGNSTCVVDINLPGASYQLSPEFREIAAITGGPFGMGVSTNAGFADLASNIGGLNYQTFFGSGVTASLDPSLTPGGTMNDAGGGAVGAAPVTEGGSSYLADQRARLMAELDTNPALRNKVIAVIANEQVARGPEAQAILESMVNRSIMRGYTSLNQAINDGFYGPVNVNGIDRLVQGITPLDRSVGETVIAAVTAGSNICNFCTDQGLLNEVHPNGRIEIGGEYFGHMAGNAAWANQQRLAEAAFSSTVVGSSQVTGLGGDGQMLPRGQVVAGLVGEYTSPYVPDFGGSGIAANPADIVAQINYASAQSLGGLGSYVQSNIDRVGGAWDSFADGWEGMFGSPSAGNPPQLSSVFNGIDGIDAIPPALAAASQDVIQAERAAEYALAQLEDTQSLQNARDGLASARARAQVAVNQTIISAQRGTATLDQVERTQTLLDAQKPYLERIIANPLSDDTEVVRAQNALKLINEGRAELNYAVENPLTYGAAHGGLGGATNRLTGLANGQLTASNAAITEADSVIAHQGSLDDLRSYVAETDRTFQTTLQTTLRDYAALINQDGQATVAFIGTGDSGYDFAGFEGLAGPNLTAACGSSSCPESLVIRGVRTVDLDASTGRGFVSGGIVSGWISTDDGSVPSLPPSAAFDGGRDVRILDSMVARLPGGEGAVLRDNEGVIIAVRPRAASDFLWIDTPEGGAALSQLGIRGSNYQLALDEAGMGDGTPRPAVTVPSSPAAPAQVPPSTPAPDTTRRLPGSLPPLVSGTGVPVNNGWLSGVGNNALSGAGNILQGLAAFLGAGQTPQPAAYPPIVVQPPPPMPQPGTPPPVVLRPSVALIASPNSIPVNSTSRLAWTALRATECEIRYQSTLLTRGGTTGNILTPTLSQTTAFSLSCVGDGGSRSATTTVYVGEPAPSSTGQTSTPAPTITATSGTGGASATSGATSGSQQQQWCDPGLSPNAFITCLQGLPGSANPIQ